MLTKEDIMFIIMLVGVISVLAYFFLGILAIWTKDDLRKILGRDVSNKETGIVLVLMLVVAWLCSGGSSKKKRGKMQ